MSEVHLILQNQLFPVKKPTAPKTAGIFMAEDWELLRSFRYHKKRLVLILSSMRHFREELRRNGYQVNYRELSQSQPEIPFLDTLKSFLLEQNITRLHTWEIENRELERGIQDLCFALRIELQTHPTPMFLTPKTEFRKYLRNVQLPSMKSFYEQQRKRLDLLMDNYGRPLGGHYSFDPENRKKTSTRHNRPGRRRYPPGCHYPRSHAPGGNQLPR